jgi:acylphosphatase
VQNLADEPDKLVGTNEVLYTLSVVIKTQVNEGMLVRARLLVSGTVQKVAYRLRVDRCAFDAELAGFVRNLEDGTVEIVCEGERDRIERFSHNINIVEYPTRVKDISIEYSEPTGEFREFTIVRDDRYDGDLAGKLDTGLLYIAAMHRDLAGKQDQAVQKQDDTHAAIKEMHADLSEKQDDTQAAIKEMHADLSEKQDETTGAVKEMDGHTCERFDRLEGKYDRFGNSLDEVSRDLKRLVAETTTEKSDREYPVE